MTLFRGLLAIVSPTLQVQVVGFDGPVHAPHADNVGAHTGAENTQGEQVTSTISARSNNAWLFNFSPN